VPKSTTVARWLIAVPLVGFGLNHLLGAADVLPLVPSFLPGGIFWVYLTGVAFMAAGVSFATERYVRLAGRLLALMFLIFVLTVYLPRLVASPSFAAARGMSVALLQAVLVGGTGLLLAGLYADDRPRDGR